MARALGDASVAELAGSLEGSVVTPADREYEQARRIWNHAIDRHPAVIVRATNAVDVVRSIQFAASEGLPLAVRGGGHSVVGFSSCDGGMVVDLSLLNHVQVDRDRRRAVAGGGTVWSTFDAATQEHGLATTGGLISSTGLGGFILGGGIGYLVRASGLTCDNLVSVELVTADGSVRRVSQDDDAELFWAVRGGGGNFGVVTSFELDLRPLGPTVLGGPVFYAGEEAVDIVGRWRDAVADVPDDLTTLMVFTAAPPLPFLPTEWHGRKVLALASCWAGEMADGEEVLRPLRQLGTVVADLVGPVPYVNLQSMLDPAWGPGAANYFTGTFVERLPDDAIETLAGFHRRSGDLPVQAELHIHQLGGAMARVPEDATAFANRTSPYIVNCVARTPADGDLVPHREWARAARDAMAAYGKGATYVNFTGESGADKVRASYPPATYERLQRVKDRVDPTNLFRLNQNIVPSS